MGVPFHQHLFPPVKKLIWEFDMLRDGDKVAVGVSGGKDSLTTLYTLATLRRMIPVNYSLTAITIDLGWPGMDLSPIGAYCAEQNIPFRLIKTKIAEVLFEIRQETNPCSLCAKMRHGVLNEAARAEGCNVVALGHHSNDAVETVFLNMFYNGRIACFQPVTLLDRANLRLIRPMLYVSESTIARVAKKMELPVSCNPCPANGNTKRQFIKDMLASQTHGDRVMPKRLLSAVRTLWKCPSN